jgi:glycosyltransferase 2 family protein
MAETPSSSRRAAAGVARFFHKTATSPGRRWWLGGTAVIVLAAVVLGGGDLARMARSFGDADWRWAGVALALMLASLVLRSYALEIIVNALGDVRTRISDTFSATSIGLLANSVIPVRVGTVLSPYVLFVLLRRRRQPLAFPTALGVTLTERMFAIATFVAMALAFLGVLATPGWAVNVLLVCGGLIAIPFVAGIWVARRRDFVANACARGGPRARRLGRWLPQLVESQRIMRRPLAALGVTGTQVAAWVLQLAAAVAMLWAFHLGAAGLRGAALVVVLTNLIGLVPATPGNVGTFQVAAVAALATYGVAAGPALAYALGLQALQLVVGIVAGLVALATQDLTLADLAGRSRHAAAALRHAEVAALRHAEAAALRRAEAAALHGAEPAVSRAEGPAGR